MSSLAPNSQEVVTSVGNSWIICRSKSYAGRIYYFNTLTGDAAWNLSEAEVEKAKNRTMILQSQPGFLFDCPEPSESPKDDTIIIENPSTMDQLPQQGHSSNIYKKQIINNKFFKSPTQFSNYQIQQCNPMNTIQLNVVSPPTNLAVWQASLTPQPIFVTPTFSQPQLINNNYNIDHPYASNNTDMLNNHFKKYSKILQRKPTQTDNTQGYKQFHKYEYNKKGNSHRVQFKNIKNNIDLRLFLSLKRRESILNQKEEQLRIQAATTHLNNEQSYTEHENINAGPSCSRSYSFNTEEIEDEHDEEENKIVENLYYKDFDTKDDSINEIPLYRRRRSYSLSEKKNDNDNSWCDNLSTHNEPKCDFNLPQSTFRSSNINTDEETDDEKNKDFNGALLESSSSQNDWKSQGDKKPLEKEVLRSILEISENVEVWYIVTDSYVLINNTHFLSNILNADKQCCLVIPQTVINKIQSAANSRLSAPAHKALYFICQQIEANTAIIDENNGDIENSNEDIINCCIQLIEKGSHVIILTGDIELYNINTSNIPMYTIAELKQLVKETNFIGAHNRSIGTYIPEEILHYKITIPNKTSSETNVVSESPSLTEPLRDITLDTVEENNISNRQACDVGVQADCVPLPPVTDDVNREETVLPDSSKTIITCNSLSRNRRKLWSKYKRSISSFGEYNGIDYAVTSNSFATDSTTNDSSLSSVDNPAWGLYGTGVYSKKHNDKSKGEICELLGSNTASVTESEKSESQSVIKVTGEDDKHVMFEITDARMEEVLTVKSEEWVSRLVQIMEEALGQVLRLDACADVRERMPPPWTLLEATECVKKCFLHDVDVVDAANKFVVNSKENGALKSAFIMRSHPTGTIKSDISPHNFMELYSYAVYLIDALQGVLMDNEDIQTASKSLSKLLSDIQDPNLDLVNHESIAEVTVREAIVTEAKEMSKEKDKLDDKIIPKGSPTSKLKKNKSLSPGKYNLRSQSKKTIEVNQENSDNIPVARIDTESSFFSSLYLMKNSSSPKDRDVCEKSNSVVELKTREDIQEKGSSPNSRMTDHWLACYSTEDISADEGDRLESRVLIDDRLKSKSNLISNFEDSNKELYQPVYGDDNFADNYDDYVNNSDYIDFRDDMLYDFEHIPKDTAVNTNLNNSENIEFESDIVTFKEIMVRLQNVIQNAYTSIQDFCVKSCESLQTLELSEEDINRIQMRAEKSSSYMHQICDRLNSILTRDKSNKSILKILERKEFEDIAIEDNDVENYRNFIANCLEQGNILKESVLLVLEAIQELRE